jgi:DNA-binding response OmpR family regulator
MNKALIILKDSVPTVKIKYRLQEYGFCVDVASGGLNGLKLITGGVPPYHLLITELILDEISGLALITTAKMKNSSVKTVAVNNGNETLGRIAEDFQADTILRSPINVEALWDTVGRFFMQNYGKPTSTDWLSKPVTSI